MERKPMNQADVLDAFLSDVLKPSQAGLAKPHEEWSDHRPRRGQVVSYKGTAVGRVVSVEASLCYVDGPGYGSAPFIWCFRDGLNNLHHWESRGTDGLRPEAMPSCA